MSDAPNSIDFIAPVGRRATTRDVASLAAVSRTTVSEIFNGRAGRFSTETVERVEAAAAELRYRPSAAARSLVTGRSSTVLVTLPALTTPPGFQSIIEDVSRALRKRNLHVLTQFTTGEANEVADEILGLNPAGVIDLGALSSQTREALEATGIPVVPKVDERRTAEFHTGIGQMMYKRLHKHQPDRLLYVTSADAPSSPYDDVRLAAMTRAAVSDGRTAPTRFDIRLDQDQAASTLREALSAPGTAGVACGTDTVALAVMAACRALCLAVPERVAVIGVDGSVEGQLVSPRLTSISTEQSQIAAGMVEEFVSALDGRSPSAAPVAVPLMLLVGDSA